MWISTPSISPSCPWPLVRLRHAVANVQGIAMNSTVFSVHQVIDRPASHSQLPALNYMASTVCAIVCGTVLMLADCLCGCLSAVVGPT